MNKDQQLHHTHQKSLLGILNYKELMSKRQSSYTINKDSIKEFDKTLKKSQPINSLSENKSGFARSMVAISPNQNQQNQTNKSESLKQFPIISKALQNSHPSQPSQEYANIQSFLKNNSLAQNNTTTVDEISATGHLQRILEKRLRGIYSLEQGLQHIIQEQGFSKDSEIARVHRAVNELSKGLENASQSEVELGIKKRELGKNNHEFQDLSLQFISLKTKFMEQEEMNKKLYKKIDDLQQQNKQNQHNLLLEQRSNNDLQQKIGQLEQRLELVLESDFAGQGGGGTKNPIESSQEKLRRTLTELVKECEGYKRDLKVKSKEIERIQDQLKQSQNRVAKINQKVEMIKKKTSAKDIENFNIDDKQVRIQNIPQDDNIMKNDPTTILVRNELYDTLDFRINSLRSEYADLIHDILEQGSSVFAQKVSQMQNNKQMRENISLITSQYLSFKDNAEKFNTLTKYTLQVLEIPQLNDQMHYIAQNFKNVFMSERCNLWVLDAQSGILYTLNDQNEQVRALMNRGIFAEVIRFQKPVHKREGAIKALYFETQLGKFQVKSPQGALIRANQTLCFPIFNTFKQVSGILEISNSFADYFSFDEEYYGVILAKFCEYILNKQIKLKIMETTITFDTMITQAFLDFTKSQSLRELNLKVRKWFQQILTISQMALYFVDAGSKQFVTFTTHGAKLDQENRKHHTNYTQACRQGNNNSGNKVIFQWNQGIAGSVRERRKSLIVMNSKKSFDYDELVDLESLLPIYVIPIIIKARTVQEEDKVVGVIEIPLKQRFYLKTTKDRILLGSSNIAGQDDSFEFVAKKLAERVACAIEILQHLFVNFD